MKQVLIEASGEGRALTLRKRIAEALKREPLDSSGISRLLGIREREVLDHLKHVARSAGQKRFVVEPARCRECGFSFKKRTRLNTPGHCPLCKSESISPPAFRIVESQEDRSGD